MSRASMGVLVLGLAVAAPAFAGSGEAKVVVFHEEAFPAIESEAPSRETLAAGQSTTLTVDYLGAFDPAVRPEHGPVLASLATGKTYLLRESRWFPQAANPWARFALTLSVTLPEIAPAADFEAHAFGPFLILRTKEPVGTPVAFFRYTMRAQLLGWALEIGDSGLNYQTAATALRTLAYPH